MHVYNRYNMQSNKTIAIIGATGRMGSGISRCLSKSRNRLILCSGDGNKVQALIGEIKEDVPFADLEGRICSVDASWEADIIILALPVEAEKEVAGKIREVANQKIVISIANPLNASYHYPAGSPDMSIAEELQELLPHSKVIKVFNTTFSADFLTPGIDGEQVDAFIAGNDEKALKAAGELISNAGFNAIVVGDLTVCRTLENMQLLLLRIGMKYNYNWMAGWKIIHN